MTMVINSMMVHQGVHDYAWYQELLEPFTGQYNHDYSSWTLEQDKYNNLCSAVSRMSNENLAAVNYYDKIYFETGDSLYEDLASQARDFRKNIVQRAAVLDSIGVVG